MVNSYWYANLQVHKYVYFCIYLNSMQTQTRRFTNTCQNIKLFTIHKAKKTFNKIVVVFFFFYVSETHFTNVYSTKIQQFVITEVNRKEPEPIWMTFESCRFHFTMFTLTLIKFKYLYKWKRCDWFYIWWSGSQRMELIFGGRFLFFVIFICLRK